MAIFIAIDLGRAALNQVHLIDVLYHLGTFKLYVSIVKYIPQVRIRSCIIASRLKLR